MIDRQAALAFILAATERLGSLSPKDEQRGCGGGHPWLNEHKPTYETFSHPQPLISPRVY